MSEAFASVLHGGRLNHDIIGIMNQISNIIRGTVSDLSEHPGYLEMGSIIHADWPAYPRGIGWKSALKSLVSYPIGMKF